MRDFCAVEIFHSERTLSDPGFARFLCPSGPFAFPLVWNCSRQLSVFPAEVEAHVHNP
jgi:hypothetical protein